MQNRQSQKQVNRDVDSHYPSVDPHSPSLFANVEESGDEITPTIPLINSNGDASVPPGGPVDTAVAAPKPEPDLKPFDLDSIIRAKQERLPSQPSFDPFDPARLKLTQDFASVVGGRRVLTTIPVTKPNKEWFVRTHPDEAYRLQTAVIELKEDRETYLVDPDLWPDLADEPTFGTRLLVASVNKRGNCFLWPVRLPGLDGKLDNWSRSAMEAAERARTGWVRMTSNMSIQAYDVFVAPGLLGEPEWPDLAFPKMLEIAFRDKYIRSLDHPVVRRLRGEI